MRKSSSPAAAAAALRKRKQVIYFASGGPLHHTITWRLTSRNLRAKVLNNNTVSRNHTAEGAGTCPSTK